jgi:hypothetical protein
MPKLPGKRTAAKAREAAKKGYVTPTNAASLKADPTYVDNPTDHLEDVATGLKHRRDDSEAESSAVRHNLNLNLFCNSSFKGSS